jgi:hypothetical protein
MPATNVTPLRRPSAPVSPNWRDVLHEVAGKHSDATITFDRLDAAFFEADMRRDYESQMALSAPAMAFMVADWSRFNGWQSWAERFERADREISDDALAAESAMARASGAMARALLTGQPLATTKPLAMRLQSMLRAPTTHVREGGVYFAIGRYAQAAQAMESASRSAADSHRVVTLGYVALARALEAFAQSGSTWSVSAQCASLLRDGLAAMRRTTTHGFFFTAPKERGIVCALALREDIESEFVREGLKQVPVVPPSWADDHWPWALSLRSFGGFRMQAKLADGQRADKASSRPLLLLKLIVAHGGKGVPVSTAMDALWPEQGGDQAEHALTVTLQRLRKLFVEDDLILRNDGWLTLNAAKVWTDVRGLEVHLEAMSGAVIDRQRSNATDESQRLQLVQRLVDLYRGNCLAGIEEAWALDRATHYRAQVTNTLRLYASSASRDGHTILAEMCSAQMNTL